MIVICTFNGITVIIDGNNMIYDDRPESIIESSYERHMKPKILFIPGTPVDTYHKNFSSSNV